ncbi:MAG TPA: hypothetical protein VKB33_04680 [Nitrospira sp.]|nr:hypothetical protein [Nitrospira sp.]
MRVAINGLGRIGRAVVKILATTPKLEYDPQIWNLKCEILVDEASEC